MNNSKDSIYENLIQKKKDLEKALATPIRIALLGKGGCGKSSLVNALVGEDICAVGARTDMTVVAQPVTYKGVTFVDLPGYGTTLFPKDSFASKFNIDDYDLFLCVADGKFLGDDETFFQKYLAGKKPALLVRTKVDGLKQTGKSRDDLKAEIVADVQRRFAPSMAVHFVDSTEGVGIPELITAIEANLGEAKRERWICTAAAATKALLEKKRAIAEKATYGFAGAAAANALNPIPVLDIAVDVGVLVQLEETIRDIYGIKKSDVERALVGGNVEKMLLAKSMMRFATKDAIVLFLKSAGKRVGIKQTAKWIPIVGQAVAAALGFGLVKMAGDDMVASCENFVKGVATEVLEDPEANAD